MSPADDVPCSMNVDGISLNSYEFRHWNAIQNGNVALSRSELVRLVLAEHRSATANNVLIRVARMI
jgi:hypothetical protein